MAPVSTASTPLAPAKLPDDHEGLRDTLFYAVYGVVAMFDTSNNAFEYYRNCKARNLSARSVMVEEDGSVWVSDRLRNSRFMRRFLSWLRWSVFIARAFCVLPASNLASA